MSTRWRTDLGIFLICSAGLLGGGLLWLSAATQLANWVWLAGCVPAVLSLLHGSLQALRRRSAGVDVLALVSIGAALLLQQTLTAAVIAVMLATGRLLESFAARRARREISALLQRAPRTACCYRDGGLEELPLAEIQRGDRLLVRHGEVLATDGAALSERVVLDESALSGETLPVTHGRGAALRSGSVNAGEVFDMLVTTRAADSTYAGIVKLVSAAQQARSPATRLADRHALWFVPLSLALAALAWLISGDPLRALAVVVVATPCPLLLAVPVAIVSAISRCAQRGILIKGGAALEALAQAEQLFFDKTGTLTGGQARLVAIHNAGLVSDDELLRRVASLEQMSPHVMAAALVAAANERALPLSVPEGVSELPGAGLQGMVDGQQLVVGGADYVAQSVALPPALQESLARSGHEGTAAVLAAIDGQYAGLLLLADQLRPETPRALRLLRRSGVRQIVMLTGDRPEVAASVALGLGVDRVLAGQSPADKLAAIQAASAAGTTVMVGDGVNDAPALAAATVGVAMGARGATASAEAADIVLLADRLDRLAEALHIARQTRRITRQSVLAGMGLSLLAMLAAALGWLPPLQGALLQEAIDVAVIFNALRVLRLRPLRASHYRLSAQQTLQLQAEHQALAPLLSQLDSLISQLHSQPVTSLLPRLDALALNLTEQLLPHERADDRELYPALAGLLGGDDPLAALSHTHREIFHLQHLYSLSLAHLRQQPEDTQALHELQRLLHALEAILRLHFAQEEEIYQSLAGG